MFLLQFPVVPLVPKFRKYSASDHRFESYPCLNSSRPLHLWASLNAPQPDAIRMQWEDSQVQPAELPQKASSANVDQPRTLRSAKRLQTTTSAAGQRKAEAEHMVEAQDTSANETAEERRTRKGKAPMRPNLRPRRGPAWASVESREQLVSDEEGSTSRDSGSEVSDTAAGAPDALAETCIPLPQFEELDEEELADKRRTAPRKVLANALFGPSREDVPVVRRAKATGNRKRSGTASTNARAISTSTSPPSPRKKRRVKRGAISSYMDDYVDDDLFMVDADGQPLFDDDGQPLKEDSTYLDAVPNRKRPGKVPRLEWSEEDKLLLYREIQKCPINAKSSFVSAVLHRYGDPMSEDSRDTLILAQSMHLRDQMKDIVKLRTSRNLPVVGNARFYLPSSDPRKAEFDAERVEATHKRNDDHEERQKMLVKLRADARKQQAKNAKKRKGKKSQDESTAEEDELEAEEDQQEAPVAQNEEQDELAIENEIGVAEVQDDGQSGEDNVTSRSPVNEESPVPQEGDAVTGAADAEEEQSPEAAPAAQPRFTVSDPCPNRLPSPTENLLPPHQCSCETAVEQINEC